MVLMICRTSSVSIGLCSGSHCQHIDMDCGFDELGCMSKVSDTATVNQHTRFEFSQNLIPTSSSAMDREYKVSMTTLY